jgi:hypothetical protein
MEDFNWDGKFSDGGSDGLHDVIVRTKLGKCRALVINLLVHVLYYTVIVNGYKERERG